MKKFNIWLEARDKERYSKTKKTKEYSFSIEPMSNGLLYVRDKDSGLTGTWHYTRKEGKIVVGKPNSGDLTKAANISMEEIQKAVDK